MRKFLLLAILLILLALGLLYCSERSAVSWSDSLHSDKCQAARYIETQTLNFLEDLRFKDFEKAATYHSPSDQEKVDIPQLIEDVFYIKPEFLDIMRYEITKVELDSTGTRGRVTTHTVAKALNADEIKDLDIIFYWSQDAKGQWYMRLESSLR